MNTDTLTTGDRVSWSENPCDFPFSRQFGILASGKGCPGIGCGIIHYHVRDAHGDYHVISARRITREDGL